MNSAKHTQSGITQQKSMEVSTNIDWISATAPYHTKRLNKTLVLKEDFLAGYQKTKGMNGYTHALRYQSGALEMENPNHPSMGVHIIYTSQAIRNACENFGCTQDEILSYLMEHSRIVRLDVCLDVTGAEIDIMGINDACIAGKVKTRAKHFDYVKSAKLGEEVGAQTAYIGSMHKRKKLLRVYDKGKQLGLDYLLTRFELETHGAIAHNGATKLMDETRLLGDTIAGMIKGYADLTECVPDGIFNADGIPVSLPKYQRGDTAKWLVDTVSKTLAREAYNDSAVFADFLAQFQFHYQNLLHDERFNDER